MKSCGAFGRHTRMRIGGYRLTKIRAYDRRTDNEQGWMLGCGQYHWVNMPMPKLFVFMVLTKCLMFKMPWTGRTPSLNISYAFIGLITSNTPHHYKSLVA